MKLSLHLGLNRVDPARYGGWSGELRGCIHDAMAMREICAARGYDAEMLFDENATADALLDRLFRTAEECVAGDRVLVSVSSHGGQIEDTNGDEPDQMDETLCLFDRMVIDDEICWAFSRFAAGVSVVFLTDACHSGTMLRAMPQAEMRHRAAPLAACRANVAANDAHFADVKFAKAPPPLCNVPARILHLGACQDSQTAGDTEQNGVFTDALLHTWSGGAFTGNWQQFRTRIARTMPAIQVPQLNTNPAAAKTLARENPFA